MENSFEKAGVMPELVKGLEKQGITIPTEIQSIIIKPFMDKKDIVAMSYTGSGKTLAYLLPLFMNVDTTLRSTQAIILTPTHELAVQVYRQAELLAENSGVNVKSALIIGGANIQRQIDKLKEKPQIVIGSSGRIFDLIKKRKIQAHTVKTIVIDEADRMIDDLNISGVEAVVKTTLRDRQIVMLSASVTDEASKRAMALMKEPVFLNVSSNEKLPENIEHIYITAEQREKIIVIRKLVHGENIKKGIVFINNNENIEVIVDKLNYHGIKAVGIYGKAHKYDRRNAIEDMREGRVNILVSSDLSARGLDIPGVTHVINIDIPEEPVYYLHRAGRTGRAGEKGKCISVVTDFEKKWIRKYEKTLGIKFKHMEMSYGKLVEAKNIPAKKINKNLKPFEAMKRVKTDKENVNKDKGFFAKKAEKSLKKQKNIKK
ncbi:helicase [Tyzzerella sp. An114]|uniref:DEAD/DEAH box helicase n=1 Tax=Tyzzerella sp. An114 TaxID=1965545 RepID=UPI000B44EC01|nr:DEAD/DEAH box helicase [Tyzzerella sp. An114]OUQ57175.1 helicase [Tyzzerella sp. An114]